ncbi:MAG: SusC/RagA family TonB-linked outer membrane protein [Bacteroidaceae bacterium]|nr:SusC/RagA family TonB-linked outer membrane protein [Bacteroidaceae bacterium]
MKKNYCWSFVLLSMLCLFTPSTVKAADRTVSNAQIAQQTQKIKGVVVDPKGEPIIGANVLVKGTSNGTITDLDGNFVLTASKGATLVITYIGFSSQMVQVTNSSSYRIVLVEDTEKLGEVIVTAMGIRKEKKALGYAVQDIKSAELLKNKTSNPLSSLSGKMAGVNITQSSGAAGAGAQIILRGGTSLERDNQPLFVVDGIIYDNSTPSGGNSAFDGASSVSTTSSNRVMDINPEDIENISVLKGPAAAALYGSKASAGVVMITTKKGKEGAVEVNVGSRAILSWANRLPNKQSTYKRGYYNENGVLDTYSTRSWGEPFADGETVYNNMDDFFQTSAIFDNSVSISGGHKNGTFYVSASRFDQAGIIPETGYDKTTFRVNGEQKYGNLKVSANVAYTLSNTDKTLTSAGLYGSGGTGSMNSVYTWARNENMSKYLNDDGSKYRMFEGLQELADDVENPYWLINENSLKDKTERLTGSLSFDYKINDWWNLTYRAGVDSYELSNYTNIAPEGAVMLLWQKGMMSESDTEYMYMSSNFMSNFHKKFGDFDLNLLIGNSVEDTKITRHNRMGYQFETPGLYSFANILADNKKFEDSHSRKRMVGLYGEFRMAYKSLAYLTVTGRNDWTSTLPIENRSYFYPSVAGSFIFSELLPDNDVISFGKVRASWARVGKDTSPYETGTSLWPIRTFLGGLPGVGNNWSRGNPYLKPETTESTEYGLEMRFLKGRIGFDLTYYTNNSYDQIIAPRLGQSTGYIFCSINAGDVRNKGMELSIKGTPIQTRDFRWDATLNVSGNRGTVENLIEGVDVLYVTDVQIGSAKAASFNNGNFMAISGSTWTRTDDGKIVLDDFGMPTSTNATTDKVGNREPKFIGGFNNSIQYKNWNLSFLWDFRVGGDVFNGTDYAMTVAGVSDRSANRETLTTTGVVKNAAGEYEDKTFTFTADGTYNMSGTQVSGRKVIMDYYQTYLPKESASFITKTNWLRLRTISLSYTMPKSLLAKTKFIKGCMFTLTGNNLILITNYDGLDPEASAAGSGVTGSSSVGMDYCGVPATMGMSFGVNLTF